MARRRTRAAMTSATRSWPASIAPLATIVRMSIPARLDAAGLLLALRPVAGILEHSMVAADVASFLAEAVRREGHPVDRALVETATLLHDLDKALPREDPLRELGHGHAGARWLEQHGHAELAPAVDSHPVGRLTEQPYPAWVAATTLEQRLVAYADKRAQRQVVSLDERFARWSRKHPEAAEVLDLARARAAELEAEVCGLAGIRPDEVTRLPWAEDAVRLARRGQQRAAS
jgi:putative nucleotidyltransferase with HDIG domain